MFLTAKSDKVHEAWIEKQEVTREFLWREAHNLFIIENYQTYKNLVLNNQITIKNTNFSIQYTMMHISDIFSFGSMCASLFDAYDFTYEPMLPS